MNFENLLGKEITYKGSAFRNIYTIIDSQDLFDDLIESTPHKNEILRKIESMTSDISHTEPQKNRVFSYGDISNSIGNIFIPPYGEGRFGDGVHYGIWYGALEEDTSVNESLYHQWKRAMNAFRQKGSKNEIITERKMFKAVLNSSKCVDLRNELALKVQLISNDYSVCRKIGTFLYKNNFSMLLSPSARNVGGTCSPVLSGKVILKENFIYYLRITFHRDGRIEKEKISQTKSSFSVPENWVL
ncbi:RES family NAD+ phosphorylase [Fluviispira multicolorata]|uniref:RES domain-containing protein n=1 Tax=Fluviispira multicolorata TaxID=2654512 RepID=A0A833JE05_9BACT|nr:RES family NAD+ phosphorylase [Fluviispira multicolorata]KAB8029190.1 RES domain-containing protein [Fluviispira multicolorata]